MDLLSRRKIQGRGSDCNNNNGCNYNNTYPELPYFLKFTGNRFGIVLSLDSMCYRSHVVDGLPLARTYFIRVAWMDKGGTKIIRFSLHTHTLTIINHL